MLPKTHTLWLFILMGASFLPVPVLAANRVEGHSADSKSATQTAKPDEKTEQGATSAPSATNEDSDDNEEDSFGNDGLDNAFDDMDDDF